MRKDFFQEDSDTYSIYLKIRNMIVENTLEPGEKILQNKLAKDIGASRTPVVKALHKLTSEGLVDNIPNRGFYVHLLNVSELLELLIIRQAFDAIVAGDVARNHTEEQAMQLYDLWKPFENLDSDKDWETPEIKQKYAKADRDFHRYLYEWCTMETLKKINETTQLLNRTYTCGLVRDVKETYQEHMAICKAILAGNDYAAAEASSLHNENTVKILQQVVKQMKMIGLDPQKLTLSEFQYGNMFKNPS